MFEELFHSLNERSDDFDVFDEFMKDIDAQADDAVDFGSAALATLFPELNKILSSLRTSVIYDSDHDTLSLAAPVAKSVLVDTQRKRYTYPIGLASDRLGELIGVEVPIGYSNTAGRVDMDTGVRGMNPRISNFGTGYYDLMVDIEGVSKQDEDVVIALVNKFEDQTEKLFDTMLKIQEDETGEL